VPPAADILEDRWLHQLFLFTHVPATWPAWKLAVGLLAVTLGVWLTWWPLDAVTASTAAAIYLVFALGDWLLLVWLPQARRSFGPIGPQLYVMTAPRLGAALLLALFGWILGSGQTPSLLVILVLLQLLGTAVYLWGTLAEPFALATSHRSITSPGLPDHTPPLRLLHLSDLHIERLTPRETKLLELIEQAKPDLIVITGDYLNLSYVDDPTARAEVRQVLEKIVAPYGVYATLGSPPVDRRETTPSLFDGLPIRLLRDEVAVLHLADGRKLSLIGMDCDHDLEGDAQVFQNLIELTPADSAKILLYHSPELMPVVQNYPVDLYLCGHTHGGQIRVPLYGAILTSSALGKRYEMGPYVEQDTTLYISRGIGLEGLSAPRMRLLCPPEIILFTLAGPNGRDR
ncbi:MAG: metallophosphoesterase, partial [Anaerolineae bacterium]|nr:metallophosphoesterase [Anaerolineae bacterium]